MSKISEKADRALRQADSEYVAYEMTEERKQRFKRVTDQIIDLLRANSEAPSEAYMILQFLVEGFESHYGIRGGVILGDDQEQAS